MTPRYHWKKGPAGFSTVKLVFLIVISIWWEGKFKLCQHTISHQIFHLFTYLFISIWTHGSLYHLVNYLIIQWIICYYTIYLDPPVVLDLSIRSLFKLTKLFSTFCIFLWSLPCFLDKKKKKMFQAYFILSLPHLWNLLSFQGALVFQREKWHLEGTIWVLVVLIAMEVSPLTLNQQEKTMYSQLYLFPHLNIL